MKKPLRILVLCLLAVSLLVTAFGCNVAAKDGETEKGLIFTKTRAETNYTVSKYIDDGVTVKEDGVLDIGAVAEEKGLTVVKIKTNAFKDNDNIKKLIVPSSIEEIEKGAFAGMKALEEIVLPFIGINNTGDGFINQTPAAENKAVDEKRSFGYLFGATEYDEGMTETFKFGEGTSDTISCYIPYTLKKITVNPTEDYTLPMYAFAGLTGVKEIELGNKVNYIGNYAFSGSDVEIVNIPENVKVIGEGAFSSCSGIKSVELGLKLESVGVKGFYHCDNLETVELKATSLRLYNEAFAYCAKLDTTELEEYCIYDLDGRVFYKAEK